jgi:hypothetical protein
MAIVDETRSIRFGGANALFTWSPLLAGDTGRAVDFSEFADRSVQFAGTFGGASVSLQGSNDGVNWHVLTDTQGAPISKTSAALSAVAEMTRYVRPAVSGGDGTTAVAAILFTLGGA